MKLMFDNKNDNDNQLIEQLHASLGFYGRDFISSKDKPELRLGFISTIISHFPIFLYNNTDLLKLAPNGFFTENMIFITSEQFSKAIQDEVNYQNKIKTHEVYSKKTENIELDSIGLLLTQVVLNFIEHKTDKLITDEEKKEIIKSLPIFKNKIKKLSEFNKSYPKKYEGKFGEYDLFDLKLQPSIGIFGTEDLTCFLEKLEIASADIIKASQKFNTTTTLNDIISDKNSETNSNNTLKNLIDNYDSINMYNASHCYNITKEFHNLFKKNIDNSLTFNDFFKTLDNDIISYSLKLNSNLFGFVLMDLISQLDDKFGISVENSKTLLTKDKEQLAHKINDNKECNSEHQKIMITIITGFEKLTQQELTASNLKLSINSESTVKNKP